MILLTETAFIAINITCEPLCLTEQYYTELNLMAIWREIVNNQGRWTLSVDF